MSQFIRIRYEPNGLNPSRLYFDGHDDHDPVVGVRDDGRLVVDLRQFHAIDREALAGSHSKLCHGSTPAHRMNCRARDFAAAIGNQRDVFCQEIQ